MPDESKQKFVLLQGVHLVGHPFDVSTYSYGMLMESEEDSKKGWAQCGTIKQWFVQVHPFVHKWAFKDNSFFLLTANDMVQEVLAVSTFPDVLVLWFNLSLVFGEKPFSVS